MAISSFAKSRLQNISDTGFARAKKLAALALKKNVDGKGNTMAIGYEQAIQYIQPYLTSGRKNEGIDAENLIAGYENAFTKLKTKQNKTNRTVGQFKIDEREIFFVTPTSGTRTDIMRDVPSMAAQISDELSLHVFSVENAIEEAKISGESADELENYLFDVQKRARMMSELNNDLLNDELSDGEVLNGYGVYVDSDPNDGELLGVAIAPLNDLPPGIQKEDYHRVDSSATFGTAYLPVMGKVSVDGTGMQTVKIGNKTWNGVGAMELAFSKKLSNEPTFKNDVGDFSLTDVVDKGTAMRKGTFSKGYTGFDAEGNPTQTTFFAAQDGKIYTLDEEARNTLKGDTMLAKDIERATNINSSFAKSLLHTEGIEPMRFTPVTASRQQQMAQESAAQPAPQAEASVEEKPTSFFNRTNVPKKPETPSVSSSTPDLIEQDR